MAGRVHDFDFRTTVFKCVAGAVRGRGVWENRLFEISRGGDDFHTGTLSQGIAARDIIGLAVRREGLGDGAALVFGEVQIGVDVFGRVEDHHFRAAD